METTLQPSIIQNIRSKITLIELVELSSVGFGLWCILTLLTYGEPDIPLLSFFIILIVIEGGLLGSWAIYNLFIRFARAIGRWSDIPWLILAIALTGTYALWAWTILDVNRWIISKLFYRGEAPVEYAWSARSKHVRKAWEQARKQSLISAG